MPQIAVPAAMSVPRKPVALANALTLAITTIIAGAAVSFARRTDFAPVLSAPAESESTVLGFAPIPAAIRRTAVRAVSYVLPRAVVKTAPACARLV